MKRFFGWYYMRIYVHVRPERVYVWERRRHRRRAAAVRLPHGGGALRPRRGAGVRAGAPRAARRRGTSGSASSAVARTRRRCSRSSRPTASRSRCACPCAATPRSRSCWIDADPLGVPLAPGLACLTAHDHDERFSWQRNFQLRGDLIRRGRRLGDPPAQARRRLRAAAGVDGLADADQLPEDAPLPPRRQAGARAARIPARLSVFSQRADECENALDVAGDLGIR